MPGLRVSGFLGAKVSVLGCSKPPEPETLNPQTRKPVNLLKPPVNPQPETPKEPKETKAVPALQVGHNLRCCNLWGLGFRMLCGSRVLAGSLRAI